MLEEPGKVQKDTTGDNMSERSIYDFAVDELLDILKQARGELHEQFKKTKPFRSVKMSKEEALSEYEQMTPESLQERVSLYGEEGTNKYIKEMESFKGGF